MNTLKAIALLSLLTLAQCHHKSQPVVSYVNSSNSVLDNTKLTEQFTSTFTFEDTDGLPLVNAEVLLGTSLSNPFVNNFVKTDNLGQIKIDQSFTELPITISAQYHIRTTFFGINPGNRKFQVRAAQTQPWRPINGLTTGYGSLKRDNYADFGLVIQGLTRQDLMSFDMNMFVSPESDTFTIEDQKVKVPSNIAFPKQTENYIIPITFEKPRYRFFLAPGGTRTVYALHGQFPFKEVVNEMRNQVPFASLINYFKFIGASIKEIADDGSSTQDLSVNEITFTNQVRLNTITVPAEKTMVLISAAEVNNRLYPVDIKKLEGAAKTTSMISANLGPQYAGSPKYLVAALKRSEDFYTNNPKEYGLSAALIPTKDSEVINQPPFIDLINTPIVDLDAWKINNLPKIKDNINVLGTYAVLSQISKATHQKNVIWEAYASNWIDQMSLPQWPEQTYNPLASQNDIINAWEVSYLGTMDSIDNKMLNLGPNLIDATSHVSYNKKEF